MNKSFIYLLVAAFVVVAGCTRPAATVNGCIEGASNSKITIMHQGASAQRLLDTLRTDENGCFRYKIKAQGKTFEPMFVSLSVDDAPVATLLVEENEQVKINAKKGAFHYTVEGSEGSGLLQQVNTDLYEASHRFDSLVKIADAEMKRTGNQKLPDSLARALSDVYVKQYRAAVTFLVKNPTSLACVAVLNEQLPNGLPVFSRDDDAIRFKIVYDSLSTRYPHSEYLQPLHDEYEYRFNQLSMRNKMDQAAETGYIDITLPDVAAKPVTLSSLEGHVVLIYFWLSTDKAQLMYNNELKELYAKYRPKGLAIYQVALDTDKAIWAKAVNDQQLPWVNVCDGLATASPAIRAYNVKNLPAAFIINKEGTIAGANLSNAEMVKKIGELCR